MKNPLFIGSTANAAFVAAILASASLIGSEGAPLEHGLMTTANASLFTEAHFSEPLTTWAVGWQDPEGYDAASAFIAPQLTGIVGQLYEYAEYPNAEAFLSDEASDDLRPIGSDFKTVDYTSSKTRREIPNRGLRIVLDWDRVKNMPNWQQHFTNMLLQRLKRNAFRRKVALALAAGTAASLTWDVNSNPDLDIVSQAKFCADSSGIAPNRALWGQAAKIARISALGGQNNPRGYSGLAKSPEDASRAAGLEPLVNEARYQNGASKTAILGSKIVLFSSYGQSGEDPSNFKSAIGTTSQGGRYAVYVRQLSVKFWEIVVETYETEFCATTLGCRTLTIS